MYFPTYCRKKLKLLFSEQLTVKPAVLSQQPSQSQTLPTFLNSHSLKKMFITLVEVPQVFAKQCCSYKEEEKKTHTKDLSAITLKREGKVFFIISVTNPSRFLSLSDENVLFSLFEGIVSGTSVTVLQLPIENPILFYWSSGCRPSPCPCNAHSPLEE